MKNVLIYLIVFILICFIVPAMLTKRTVSTGVQENNSSDAQDNQTIQKNEEVVYEYNKYGTINLLHKKTGEVEQVNIDEYLCNVVSAEMPADYEIEALKAQAIVARTYVMIQHVVRHGFQKMID